MKKPRDLGACPRIEVFFEIKKWPKKLPQAYYGYVEDNFLGHDKKFGEKDILGQTPRVWTGPYRTEMNPYAFQRIV